MCWSLLSGLRLLRTDWACGRGRPRRSNRSYLEVQQLESRCQPAVVYQLDGLNLGAYSGPGENPNQGDNQITAQELRERIGAVAQYTEMIRTFGVGTDLQPAGQIIHEFGKRAAIQAWISPDLTANQAQLDVLVELARQGHVDVAIVGSEVLLRGDVSESTLLGYIHQTRTRLRDAGVNIPVTTADTYHVLLDHPQTLQAVDVVYANIYPFWEGVTLSEAVGKLHRDFQRVQAAAPDKEVVVAETGWPSAGQIVGAAIPSADNAAYYFQNFVSWARAEGVSYFYFESTDEAWKRTREGEVGAHWGLMEADHRLKPGMERVFNGETLPDNWSSPPANSAVIDFFGLPNTIETNLSTFLVAAATSAGNTVRVNGVEIPPTARDEQGAFAYTVTLTPGANALSLAITSNTGQPVASATKSVVYDAGLSTADRELLYVDVVPDGSPALDGTVVLDTERRLLLGFLPGKHVVGKSPDNSEIYFSDRTVLSTGTHQPLLTLAFSQDIPPSGFLVSNSGEMLYSRTEALHRPSNTLQTPLPVDIRLPDGFSGAAAAGGPAITPDDAAIYSRGPAGGIVRIDLATRTATETGISGLAFLSDLEVSRDGAYLLVSEYGGGNRLGVYTTTDHRLVTSFALADFAGEIGLLGDGRVVAGAAGNPRLGGGRVGVFTLAESPGAAYFAGHLADNLTTSLRRNEVFVSSGDRLGVDVLSGDGVRLATYFLGVHRYVDSVGRPHNAQIRGLTLKLAPNRAPVLHSIGSRTFAAGEPIALTARASDPDGDSLVYSLLGAPDGVVLHATRGEITWTPSAAQGSGRYTFTVRVTDDGNPALSDEETVTLTLNAAPTLDPVGSQVVVVGSELSFRVSGLDPDGFPGSLSYSVAGLPAGASFDPASQTFTWNPTPADGPRTHHVTFTVTDGHLAASETIAIAVEVVHAAPVAASMPPRPLPRGVTVSLFRRKSRQATRLFVLVRFEDTGEVKSQFPSPFPLQRFTAIRAVAHDSDGDGIPDSVLITARNQKKKRVARLIT